MNRNVSVVIQAGGRSSRMGRDKGLVLLVGKPMIEHVIDRVADLGDEILITTNDPARYARFGLRLAGDEEPGAGALHGLQTALAAATGDYVLVLACDMPFVVRALLQYQIERALDTQADVVVPHWNDMYQTMHAIYRREPCLEAVTAALERGEKRMISFYDDVTVLVVEADDVARFSPTGRSFLNINTPEELETIEKLLRDD